MTRADEDLAGAERARGQRREQADAAGAQHEHALPGARPPRRRPCTTTAIGSASAARRGSRSAGTRKARLGLHAHELGHAAAAVDAVDLQLAAAHRLAGAALVADAAGAEGLDRDALARREAADAVAERVDLAGHLVARRRAGGPEARVEEVQIAAADAAREQAHAHVAGRRLGNRRRAPISICSRPVACAARIVGDMRAS